MDESDLYDEPILNKAASASRLQRLSNPDVTVERVSRVCGSRIAVDLTMAGDRVAEFGQRVEACALGRASAAILADAVIGRTADEIHGAADQLRQMLKHRKPAPGGVWADLAILAPVADIPTRHASVLLPFDAVEEALGKLGAASARRPANCR